MAYTSNYAHSELSRKDRPAKTSTSSKKTPVTVSSEGKKLKSEKFTRKDAVDFKERSGSKVGLHKIRKAGVKVKF